MKDSERQQGGGKHLLPAGRRSITAHSSVAQARPSSRTGSSRDVFDAALRRPLPPVFGLSRNEAFEMQPSPPIAFEEERRPPTPLTPPPTQRVPKRAGNDSNLRPGSSIAKDSSVKTPKIYTSSPRTLRKRRKAAAEKLDRPHWQTAKGTPNTDASDGGGRRHKSAKKIKSSVKKQCEHIIRDGPRRPRLTLQVETHHPTPRPTAKPSVNRKAASKNPEAGFGLGAFDTNCKLLEPEAVETPQPRRLFRLPPPLTILNAHELMTPQTGPRKRASSAPAPKSTLKRAKTLPVRETPKLHPHALVLVETPLNFGSRSSINTSETPSKVKDGLLTDLFTTQPGAQTAGLMSQLPLKTSDADNRKARVPDRITCSKEAKHHKVSPMKPAGTGTRAYKPLPLKMVAGAGQRRDEPGPSLARQQPSQTAVHQQPQSPGQSSRTHRRPTRKRPLELVREEANKKQNTISAEQLAELGRVLVESVRQHSAQVPRVSEFEEDTLTKSIIVSSSNNVSSTPPLPGRQPCNRPQTARSAPRPHREVSLNLNTSGQPRTANTLPRRNKSVRFREASSPTQKVSDGRIQRRLSQIIPPTLQVESISLGTPKLSGQLPPTPLTLAINKRSLSRQNSITSRSFLVPTVG